MRWLVVAAFGVFVYRVGTVEVEPLYYFLGSCASLSADANAECAVVVVGDVVAYNVLWIGRLIS
jgi:hypothetical protein